MRIGSKVYYDKQTGNVIVVTPESAGIAVETTKEQDFNSYVALSERNPDQVDFIQLEPNQVYQSMIRGGRIERIDLETLEPLLVYPSDVGEEPSPPTFSLESQIADLKQQLAESDARNEKLAEENTLNQIALMELHAMLLSTLPDEGNAE